MQTQQTNQISQMMNSIMPMMVMMMTMGMVSPVMLQLGGEVSRSTIQMTARRFGVDESEVTPVMIKYTKEVREAKAASRERRKYLDTLSDKDLIKYINDNINKLVPNPSTTPPVKGELITTKRMILIAMANYPESWLRGITA